MKQNQSSIVTAASIAAQRQTLATQLASLDTQEKALKDQEVKAKAAFDSLPATLGGILGRKVSLSEVLGIGTDYAKGALNLFGAANHASNGKAERQYRQPMTQAERDRLKEVLTARQVEIDAGKVPAHTLSQISAQFGVTDATVNKWKAAWHLTRASR